MVVVEVPAYFVSWLAARGLPRRLSFTGFTLLGALALLLIQTTLDSESDQHTGSFSVNVHLLSFDPVSEDFQQLSRRW